MGMRPISPTTVLNENTELEKVVNDRSRKVRIRGRRLIVPLKFDADGNPATIDKVIIKQLSLNDLRFLKAWKDSGWDIQKARSAFDWPDEKIQRLVRKLQCFREEDAKVRALCEIPTPDWIAAKHVENIYDGGALADSQQKSLAELAKIEGAYKQQAVTTQINVFNLPPLTPEQEAKLKPVFDTLAEEQQHVA